MTERETAGDEGRWAVVLHHMPAFAGLCLLLSLAGAGWAFWRDGTHAALTRRGNALIIASERLLSSLKDVETGTRGFIITGREDYLEPFRSGAAAVVPDLSQVVALLDGPAERLSGLVSARVDEAARDIETYRREGPAAGAAAIQAGAGKNWMDQVREEVTRIQKGAEARIGEASGSRRFDELLRVLSIAGLVLSCAGLATVALIRRREQRESQALFEGVLENAPLGLGILDRTLRIRHINPALARMSERALKAEPGLSIWDVIPHMRDSLEGRLDRVAEGGRAANAEIEVPSATRADQFRSFQTSFYPIRRERAGGETAGVGMIIMDVTARKRAERATRESEERFRALLEASAAIIWTTGPTGEFVSAQPDWERFTGQTTAESAGWGRLACLHSEERERVERIWEHAILHREPFSSEHRLRRADGAWRHMALSVAPVTEENGSVREWIASDVDITERKEAELALGAAKDAAEAANRAKSAFLANMSHELRTPLSAVIGYSEMLEEEAGEAGETGMLSDLGKIKSNARHLLGLINDVLDLSKIEANKMDVYAEEIALEAFVQDAAHTVEALIARKGNRLVLDLGPALGLMRSDAVKLRQCLFNLLGNAAKFTQEGTVTLGVRREAGADGDTVLFTVRDTGIGMTPEQMDRLFQRFTQADASTTRRFGGTGLGLALSQAFARLLGGTITVETRAGEGSCFTLAVPAVLADRGPGEPEEAGAFAERDNTGTVVLVIDDEASQRDMMARFLGRQGFSVRAVPDGAAGLEAARRLQPRVVLLDVMMPGMDGWAVLRALKEDPLTAHIPVVMVSFVADLGMGTALGAADAVPKPVDWARLKTLMEEFRTGGGDVLVVDDDPDARERVRTALERSGWSVAEAGDGQEALARVSHAPPHLILLDLTMPVMDGFVFLDRLREMPGGSDIPVIVLSARDISADERVRLAGVDRILRKGETSLRDLADSVREFGVAPAS